ncbi:uncharacterized protein LOC100678814 isoform X2 [Nasonia vitripennis]|uniref:Uncharacterized protein n=1 Tax=Nasonia vitripennis TaxID=7425 RepID=A0A7M7IPU4_NASVI|nr:uncharacterized protein LOC100678814 isoform X2 [Nasonia vitripennis]
MPCIHRWCVVLLAICLLQFARCEDPQNAEAERLRNTPPELSSVGGDPALPGQAQARFLPFSASFSLSAGGNNAQTFSIAGTPDGIGLSQSSSHGSAGTNGNPGSFSASQSSSVAAGLNGISASDSNAFAANHPLYGPTAQANGNSFAVGQAAASAHGDVVNGQAVSGAQSSVGGTHSQASSSANAAASAANSQNLIHLRPERPAWGNAQPNYASGNNNGKPSLTITVSDDRNRFGTKPTNGWYEVPETPSRESWRRPAYCDQYNGWYRDPRCRSPKVVVTKPTYRPSRPVYFENTRDPRQEGGRVQISAASAASSAQSGPGGLSIGQSSAQSQSLGDRQPGSLTINRVEAFGNAQAHAQGAAVHHHLGRPGNLQASLGSGSASASSRPGGFAQGSSVSSSSGGNTNSQVNTSSGGGGAAHGAASAGSVVTFPGPSSAKQIIPKEFIRSKRPKDEDDFDELITDFTDTVYEFLDV